MQTRELVAGRELNALVAREVMGLTGTKRVLLVESPPYSTDITAAWQVVERMDSFEMFRSVNGWVCSFDPTARDHEGEFAETAPLAICKAALASVEK